MKRFTNNLIANFVGRGWALISAVIFVPFYIKFLGVEAYGLVGFYASLQGVLVVADMGLTATLNRELARLSTNPENAQEMRNTVRTLESLYCVILVVVAIVIVSTSHFIAFKWVNAESLDPLVIQRSVQLMGIAVALQLMSSLYQGGLVGLERQVQLNMIFVVMGIVRSVGVILALWLIAPTISVFFIWQAGTNLLQVIWMRQAVWQGIPKSDQRTRYDVQVLQTVWRYAAGMMGITLTASTLRQADKIVLSKMLPLETFGLYTIAWTVAQTPISVMTAPVYRAVFPKMTQLAVSGDEVKTADLYHKSSQLVTALSAPITLVISMFATWVLFVWLGDKPGMDYTAQMLQLLVVGQGLMGILTMPNSLQLSYGWTSLGVYNNLALIVVIVPTMILLVHLYGAIGACVTWVLLNVLVLFVYMQLLHSRYLKGELKKWYLTDLAVPAFAAFVPVFIFWWLMPKLQSRLAALGVLGVVWILSSAAAFVSSQALWPIIKRSVGARLGFTKAKS